ncbi:MAG: hypothetical protein V1920_04750, partial [Bacillota bacterium]
MKIITLRKNPVIIYILLLSFICINGSVCADFLNQNCVSIREIRPVQISSGYIDITAEEAWEMCASITNGITIPIDVRTDPEWTSERINTPYPEFP